MNWEWLTLKRSPSAEFEHLKKVFLQKRQTQPQRSARGQTEKSGRSNGGAALPPTPDMALHRAN